MIIVTQKNGFTQIYKGRIVIYLNDYGVMITAQWQEGDWDGNSYDLYYLNDIESIRGE